jgi:hypothetical protein
MSAPPGLSAWTVVELDVISPGQEAQDITDEIVESPSISSLGRRTC